MNPLRKWAAASGSVALSAVVAMTAPATAHATPPIGVSAVVLSKQTVDGKDYIVSEITIAPNGSTGWHTHQGQIYGIIKSGVLTHYESDCHQDGVYGVGAPSPTPPAPITFTSPAIWARHRSFST